MKVYKSSVNIKYRPKLKAKTVMSNEELKEYCRQHFSSIDSSCYKNIGKIEVWS